MNKKQQQRYQEKEQMLSVLTVCSSADPAPNAPFATIAMDALFIISTCARRMPSSVQTRPAVHAGSLVLTSLRSTLRKSNRLAGLFPSSLQPGLRLLLLRLSFLPLNRRDRMEFVRKS